MQKQDTVSKNLGNVGNFGENGRMGVGVGLWRFGVRGQGQVGAGSVEKQGTVERNWTFWGLF